MFLDLTNKRIDGIVREFQNLNNCLKYSQKDIDKVKATLVIDKNAFKDLDKLVKQLHSTPIQSDIVLEQFDYLENQSRRNIIIDGITSDHAGESWAKAEIKVRELLTTKLKMEANSIQVEHSDETQKDPEAS